jgi:Cu(I)/Ag(I) efflux system membrane protein CusA/SilA
MIGGMVSSTVLTLVVIPAVYAVIKGWGLSGRRVYGQRSVEGRRRAS